MNIKGSHELYKLHAALNKNNNGVKTDTTKFDHNKNQIKSDTISISSKAAFQNTLDAKISEYKNSIAETSETSKERIAKLKEKYQGDQCDVSPFDVASAILNKITYNNYFSEDK